MKPCSKCGESKPDAEFYKRTNGALHAECKECYKAARRQYWHANLERSKAIQKRSYERNKPRILAYRKKYAKENAKHIAARYRRAKFGVWVSPEDYDRMVESQNNLCAICHKPQSVRKQARGGEFKKLAVDHNHTTGAVRGLLCDLCNRALGLFKDDISVLESAISYLKYHEERANQLRLVEILTDDSPPNEAMQQLAQEYKDAVASGLVLSTRDSETVAAALLSPPPANPALTKAAKDYKAAIDSGRLQVSQK